MIERRSMILDEADRWLFHLVVLVSVYITFRGHNAPGGGFAGGLIAGCAFVLRFLAGGSLRVRGSTIVHPTVFIGLGLAVAVLTAIAPLPAGQAMLESTIWKLDIPFVGQVKIVSSALFDIGVYLLVIGVVLTVLVALGSDPTVAALVPGNDDEDLPADDRGVDAP
jgi:multicomponent Na+:H+ antiporter subunit B